MRIIADDKIPFLRGVLEPFAEVIYMPGRSIDRKALREADALLTRTRTKCNRETLENTKVKFIGTATIGYDHIDTGFCESAGIYWTNAPGCNSSSVQQYIMSALFSISQKEGFSLTDKTIGIVGVGNVGSKVEKAARLFGMKVLLNDPPRERAEGPGNFTSLDELAAASDIVTVHVPLNMDGPHRTLHLFDEDVFSRMKDDAWFINSSRGEVAATGALKKALRSGAIRGAVLDVCNGTAMVVNALSAFFRLPLLSWYPSGLPVPVEGDIVIDCRGKTDLEVAKACVLHTYKISEDSKKLRADPGAFENLRGSYPVRRETGAFRARVSDASTYAVRLLKDLGFAMVES
ncbi:MAG: 4-phosphoerythronate dehydrogenase [Bacteroidales bacterium]|nr:4-phosphoerythronate dehydrogenase [Bacteroidales bacterium]